jgi:hypothetical protein
MRTASLPATSVPILILFSSLALPGCAKQEDTTKLDAAIAAEKGEIEKSEAERSKFGQGSPLELLASLRSAIHRQTLAMLEQKRASYFFYSRLNYQIDGRSYAPPVDVEQRKAAIDARLSEAQNALQSAENKARSTGGLVGALANLEVETSAVTIAQLQYQRDALHFAAIFSTDVRAFVS